MAQNAVVESLTAIAGRETADLFGSGHDPAATRAALSGLATMKQFGILARDFFARLTRRCLDYFLSRELPNHVGLNARFRSHAEFLAFEDALDRHCRETALIVRDFAGEWFSKSTYQGGIDPPKAGGFAHVALDKVLSELRVRHEAHA